jgi:hypothetical protein
MAKRSLLLNLVSCLLAVAGMPGPVFAAPPTAPGNAQYIFWHLTPAEGATPEQTMAVERALRTFFETQQKQSLMDGLTMDSLLLVDGNEKYLRCGMGPGCLAGLGEAAGVPWVIAGQVSVRQGKAVIDLVRVDRHKKLVTSHAALEAFGPLSQSQIEELALAMFQPDRYRGAIELSCAVSGAEVLLDGQKIGETPLAGPLTDLPAGLHTLEIKKLHHQTFSREVLIPVGKTKPVVAMLPEQLVKQARVPFYKDWMFWTFTGVGLVGIALGAFLNVDAATLQDNADALRQANLRRASSEQNKADSRYLGAYISYGIGGAGLLAAGVVAILALARGDEPASDTAPKVVIAPTPAGAGMVVTWRF